MKVMLADSVALMANRPPPTVMVSPELLERSVQQTSEAQGEMNSLKKQLGR